MHPFKSFTMRRERSRINIRERLLLYLIVLASLRLSTAKEIPGFLNIDCGSGAFAPYEDPETKLTWENDDRFTQAGKNGNSSVNSGNIEMSTFRYFPNHHQKHCYELPLTRPNISFLVRAKFSWGDFTPSGSRELGSAVSKFHLAVNATVWYTVIRDTADVQVTAEGIFYSPGETVNFCLIEDQGVSFISSLELRELDREGMMYSFESSQSMCFISIWREYFAPYSDTVIRYPDDPYDRLWANGGNIDFPNTKFISNSSTIRIGSNADLNYIPASAMLNAALFNTSTSVSIQTIPPSVSYSYDGINPGGMNYFVYGVFYFQDLTSSGEPGNFTLSVSGHESPPLTTGKNGKVKYEYPYFLLPSQSLDLRFENDNKSERFSFLNAAETYQQRLYDFTTTGNSDDQAIKFLRRAYHLLDWEGDPCIPVPLPGLSCIGESDNVYGVQMMVTSLSLSKLGRPSNMSSLRKDDIALVGLQQWSLTNANVDDEFFDVIGNNILGENTSIYFLDLSYNNITRIPSAPSWRLSFPLYTNFSYNNIQGEMPWFDSPSMLKFPGELNLSHNQITSLPSSWRNGSNGPYSLFYKLDFSHNLISENVSSLDVLLDRNQQFLIELHASNNKFEGTFNSVSYFSTLKYVRFVNFDKNNIGGILDLSLWIDSWQQNAHNRSYIGGTFSLINNTISGIHPNAEELEPTLLNFSNYFLHFRETRRILLDGNPYCNHLGRAKLYTQEYLCNIHIQDSKKNNLLKILLPSLLGGLLLTVVIMSSLFVEIWRLRKRLLLYQSIQDKLAQRNVQPPIFSLHEIKRATQNFHADNMLGKGGFGIVYKGILGDGTLVAVKKLIDLERVQDIDEFLNEVVVVNGIKHKNLIQLKGCCFTDRERMLVLEYAEEGNLEQALHGSGEFQPLDMETRINLCFGIAQGLLYLHGELQSRIIHRDIKPANILLDQNFNAKIADFGLARLVADDSSDQMISKKAGTWGYLAPEFELSDKTDVFSFGILVLEIMSGRKCLHQDIPTDDKYLRTWAHQMDKNNTLLNLLPEYLRQGCDENAITSLLKLAVNCTDMRPENRPSMFLVLTMLGGIFPEPNTFVEEFDDQQLSDFKTVSGVDVDLATISEADQEDTSLIDPEHSIVTSPLPRTFEIKVGRKSRSFPRRSTSLVKQD